MSRLRTVRTASLLIETGAVLGATDSVQLGTNPCSECGRSEGVVGHCIFHEREQAPIYAKPPVGASRAMIEASVRSQPRPVGEAPSRSSFPRRWGRFVARNVGAEPVTD